MDGWMWVFVSSSKLIRPVGGWIWTLLAQVHRVSDVHVRSRPGRSGRNHSVAVRCREQSASPCGEQEDSKSEIDSGVLCGRIHLLCVRPFSISLPLQYKMAPALPLLLSDCVFPQLRWNWSECFDDDGGF